MDGTIDINELIQDDKNFNLGTYDGDKLIEKSFTQFGAGRSILIDKDNKIIAGNKSAEKAIQSGIKEVKVVETTGDKLVVVKRTDIDIDSKEGRELAIADNITASVNLQWDVDNLYSAQEEFEGFDPMDWGVTEEDLYGKDPKSQGEVDVDLFDEEQELKVKLTPMQYEQATQKLAEYGDDLSQSLLLILGYNGEEDSTEEV